MTTELAIPQDTIAKLDEIAYNYQITKKAETPFSNALAMASAISQLRALMDKRVMDGLLPLMNSPLGFLTDHTGRLNWKGETKPLYTMEVVRDCLIEGFLRGLYPVNNEINIIADRCYPAKNGLSRLVRTNPNISNFSDTYSIPKLVGETGAIVTASATWKQGGVDRSFSREFAIKGDKYAGSDSYVGKATRKLLAAVYERITGQSIPEGEVEPDLASMRSANPPESEEMQLYRANCKATEEYNAKMREQGQPEEPMPEPPQETEDSIPMQTEVIPAPLKPWREVLATDDFKAVKGKALGSLELPVLQKMLARIEGWTPEARGAKMGINELSRALREGIKELSDAAQDTKQPEAKAQDTKLEPVKETPEPQQEAPQDTNPNALLRNKMQAAGVSDEALLAYIKANRQWVSDTVEDLVPKHVSLLLDGWDTIVEPLKKLTAKLS